MTTIMQIKANKRYAGSSKWTVQVHLHWTHFLLCCMNIFYKTTGQQLVMLCKNSICDAPSFGTVVESVNRGVFYICVIDITTYFPSNITKLHSIYLTWTLR